MKQAQLSNKAVNPPSGGSGANNETDTPDVKPLDIPDNLGMKNHEMARRAGTFQRNFDSHIKYMQSKIPGATGSATTVPGNPGRKPTMSKYSGLHLIADKSAGQNDALEDTVGNIGGIGGGLYGGGLGGAVGANVGGASGLMGLLNGASPKGGKMLPYIALRALLGAGIGGTAGGVGGFHAGRGLGRAIVPNPPTAMDKLKDLIQSTGSRIKDSLPGR